MRGPGFRSESSGAEVVLYGHGDDPLLFAATGKRGFTGRFAHDSDASVISVHTSKSMGAAAGTFTVTVKPSDKMGREHPDLRDVLNDDDWVDITLFHLGAPSHVMRGLVQRVEEAEVASGSGTSTRGYTISGVDFGDIFARTPIYYNQFRAENVAGQEDLRLQAHFGLDAPPDELVQKFLYGYIQSASRLGRSNWLLPEGMPGRRETFEATVLFNSFEFSGIPTRAGIFPQFVDLNGSHIWPLAQEWSDPTFCELWCDLGQSERGGAGAWRLKPNQPTTPADTRMAVFFRDRPHPHLEPDGLSASPWFSLPTADIEPQDINSRLVGKSGHERYNSFVVSPQLLQDLTGSRSALTAPLWDLDSVRRHGLLEFPVESRYLVSANDLVSVTSTQRRKLRDWHGINPYLLSGTLKLGHSRPDIRIGMRARVLAGSENAVETYYVEQVTNTWSLGKGRTDLGVTRGWRGTDASYMQALQTLAERYELAA